MAWNWTPPDWPDFRYDASALEPFEQMFLLSSGEILGAVHHVSQPEREQLRIELLSEEAMQTSAIEGEILDRLSVQSSLRRHLGLDPDNTPAKPREQGVAEMMVDVYLRWMTNRCASLATKAAAQAQRACLSVFRRGGGSTARLAYSGIPSGEPTTKKAAMNYRHETRQALRRARAALEGNDDENLSTPRSNCA